MLKTLMQLLGEDVPVLRRYVWMAVAYGLICGLTIVVLVPLFSLLFTGKLSEALPWLAVLLIGLTASWIWRCQVEQAGVRVGVVVLQGARHRLGDHIASLPVGWFTRKNTAQLSHVVTQGMMTVAQLPAHVFTPVISGVVTPLVILVALFTMHWVLGLIGLVALPLMAGVFLFTARLSRRADEAFHRRFADASQQIVEFAQAQSVLRAFSGESSSTRFLEQAIGEQRQSGRRLIWLSTVSAVLNTWAVQAVFAVLLIANVMWLDGYVGGELAEGEVIAVVISLLLVNRFIEPLLDVIGYGEVLRGARGQLDMVREILAAEPLTEPLISQAAQDASVELRGVHFGYAPGGPEVLHDLNLHIAPGSMIALVGESGSGKSTVLRLIARFFDVNQGAVLVGGVDVRQMSASQLTDQISQIFQDSYLFAGSIADNIRIGKPDASDAQIMQAAQQAGVAEILGRLPAGIDTLVGEGGARLSGGERQRVAIARALIKDAPILLVDEATAALDAENQAAIADALGRLCGQRTLIVIAHQLSTVAMADQIVVLEDGKIVEQGTPAQLRDKGGRYAQFLARRQAARGWCIVPPAVDGARF